MTIILVQLGPMVVCHLASRLQPVQVLLLVVPLPKVSLLAPTGLKMKGPLVVFVFVPLNETAPVPNIGFLVIVDVLDAFLVSSSRSNSGFRVVVNTLVPLPLTLLVPNVGLLVIDDAEDDIFVLLPDTSGLMGVGLIRMGS